MNREIFMVDQVRPKQKVFSIQRKVIPEFLFEVCIAVVLIVAVSIVF